MHEPFTTAESTGLTDGTVEILDSPAITQLPPATARVVRDALAQRLLAGRIMRAADVVFIAESISDDLDDAAFEIAARRATRRAAREW